MTAALTPNLDGSVLNENVLHLRVPAKVNLFLHVTGRRPDGYHLLESVFCPVSLYDRLSLRLSAQAGVRLQGGLPGVEPDQDLAVRAARALLARVPGGQHIGADITLEKFIPAGAGLGGGSADAAFTLMGLNHLLGDALDIDVLHDLAIRLGADVPFFLLGKPAFVSGIGEELQPLDWPEMSLVLVKPPVHIPTAAIFGSPDLTRDCESVKISVFGFSGTRSGTESPKGGESASVKTPQPELPSALFQFLSDHTRNVLQVAAVAYDATVQRALDSLLELPTDLRPRWARMTGSGSAVFGVFDSLSQARSAATLLEAQLGTTVGKLADPSSASQWSVHVVQTLADAQLKNQIVQV